VRVPDFLSRHSKVFGEETLRKFIRFSLVGIANTAVDWLIFFLLVWTSPWFSSTEVLAKSVSFLAAVVVSFLLNSLWTFRDEVNEGKKQGVGFWNPARLGRFLATSLVGLVINTGSFSVVRQLLSSLPGSYARILSLMVATVAALLWNFVVNLKWAFKVQRPSKVTVWNKAALGVVILLLLIASLSSLTDSITTDEVAHIASGYSYVTSQRMLLNLEHPPLIKLLSAIPLTVLHLNPPSLEAVAEKVRSEGSPYWVIQWEAGFQLIFNQKIDPKLIVFLARFPLILLLGLTGWFVYLLGKKVFGSKAGLIALLFFAFSPSFLAHGRLVTTDVGATFGFVSTLYFLYRYLKEGQNKKDLILVGIFLGIANLLKFSCLFLYPIIGILTFLVFTDSNSPWLAFKKAFKVSLPIFLLGFSLTILSYYLIFPKDICCHDARQDSLLLSDYYRFTTSLVPVADSLGVRPILNYFIGAGAVATRIIPGNSPFVLGEVSNFGWIYFFPLSFLLKEPLPTVIGLVLALGFVIYSFRKGKEARAPVLFLMVPAVLYSLFAFFSRFDLGIRHILPSFPFLYILIAGALVFLCSRFRRAIWLGVFLVSWLIVGTLLSFPNYLAYFNEIQPLLGLKKYEIFLDSNLDWGQNIIRLSDFVKQRGIEKIKVNAWYDDLAMKAYIPQSVGWGSGFESDIAWYAVGATTFQGSKGQEDDPFLFLRDKTPVEVVGDGILVYRITKE